jgi:hypothetical protein
MTKDDLVTALAPAPEPFEAEWSRATLAGILAADPGHPARSRRGRRLALAGVAAGVLALGTTAAVAAGGPEDAVKSLLTQFRSQPNTLSDDTALHDPMLVAQFETSHGVYAVWVATSAAGQVCSADTDGTWDGTGTPTKEEIGDYGCGGEVLVGNGPRVEELTRPDQLGGFFKDTDPLIYGVSPYADAVSVRVLGDGVDRTLPVRSDSHGYGAALPEAAHARAVTLTFFDAAGQELGSKRLVAPIG